MTSLEEVMVSLGELSEDRRVPKNVRASIKEVIDELNRSDQEMNIKINTVLSILDEVSNDPNISAFTRTEVWNIVSQLESLQLGN